MRASSRMLPCGRIFRLSRSFIGFASGFVAAKFGLPYVEPLTFLTLRMIGIVILLGAVIALTRPKWPDRVGIVRSALTGLMVHGLYLGGVFVSIENGLSAGVIALLVAPCPSHAGMDSETKLAECKTWREPSVAARSGGRARPRSSAPETG